MYTQEDAPSPSGDDVLEGALRSIEDDGSIKCAEPRSVKLKKARVRTPRKSLLEELEATLAEYTSVYNNLTVKWEAANKQLEELEGEESGSEGNGCEGLVSVEPVREGNVCDKLVHEEQVSVYGEQVLVCRDDVTALTDEVRKCEDAAGGLDEILGSTKPVRSAKEAKSTLVRWLHEEKTVAAKLTQVDAIIRELSATREMHQSRADLQAANYDRDGNPAQQPGDAFEALSHVMNVNCSQKVMAAAEEAWAREERPEPPPPDAYHVRIPGADLATIYADANASEATTDERETFFLSKEASLEDQASDPARHRVFQSMTTRLPLGGKDASAEEAVTVTAIVDSGAAWCAANATDIREHFPNLWRLLRPSSKTFKDASDNPMPLVGTVEMAFGLASYVLLRPSMFSPTWARPSYWARMRW